MKKLRVSIWLMIGFLFPIQQSNAWGMIGHRVIGKIAETYLNPVAKSEIGKILGNETLALSSTWADFIRSDSSYGFLSPWHYINFAPGLSFSAFHAYLNQDTAADAYTRINLCIRELKVRSNTVGQKRFYLRLLVHIVGDIHMPFHTGREVDAGGNKIQVSWFGQHTNMHHLWDEQLIVHEQLSYSEYTEAINFCTPAQRMVWSQGGLQNWLFESYQIVEKLYAEGVESNQKLGYRYSFDHIETVNTQLLKAGVRLAHVLNSIFS